VIHSPPSHREADHVADDRVAERRAVAARRRGDVESRRPRRLSVVDSHGASPRAEPPSAARPDRGDHDAGRRQQRAAGGVEVVLVVVVREQDRVDRAQLRRGDRRPDELARRVPSRSGTAPGRVERRVGQQPPAAELDQDRRAADGGSSLTRGARRRALAPTRARSRRPPPSPVRRQQVRALELTISVIVSDL
jgi:hypothetical protein